MLTVLCMHVHHQERVRISGCSNKRISIGDCSNELLHNVCHIHTAMRLRKVQSSSKYKF